jgi:DNA-binding response OmpR family regulator
LSQPASLIDPAPSTYRGKLPKRSRLLYVTTIDHPADWLRDCFDAVTDIRVEKAAGSAEGLASLREESFAAVIVRHRPPDLDALAFVEALRASGADDPLVVIGDLADHGAGLLCCEAGADEYLTVECATPRRVVWAVARAVEWRRVARENQRLAEQERHRLRLEHGEAERLLAQQRDLINGLEDLTRTCTLADTSIARSDRGEGAASAPLEAPGSLVSHYVDLLRAQIIMGSGNLAAETSAVVDSLHALKLPVSRVMQLHLHALETTLRGLGSRSSRHVMARADLLVLEVMMQLAERYRQGASA